MNSDDYLIGTAAEMFMLRKAANAFPTEIIMKSKFLFIGRILELLEVRCPVTPLHGNHSMPNLRMFLFPPSWESALKGSWS